MAIAVICLVVAARAADDGKPAEKNLPNAKEVLERYAKAIGGKEAFQKYHSQHGVGKVQMNAQGIVGKLEVFAARPNKLLMRMSIPGVGAFDTGFDGKTAWLNSPLTGPMLLEGKSGQEVATQADYNHALHDPADYKVMETLETEEFNGEECYKLKLVHRAGFESIEYFSKATGLQRGFSATQESPLGPVKATTTITDYKQFGELFMPARISQKVAGTETVMTLESVEYNEVDPKIFELPAEVKTLLESPAEDPTPRRGDTADTEKRTKDKTEKKSEK